MLGRWGKEGLHSCYKEEVCVYFECKCPPPCSVKAAGSFLGERAHLFSGIEFPAAALRERQLAARLSPHKTRHPKRGELFHIVTVESRRGTELLST
jgi:hypothetical protein